MYVIQLVAYSGRIGITEYLDASRRTLLGVFASLVVLSKGWVTRLLCDDGGFYAGWWRDESKLAGVDASMTLALSDEGHGTLVGDDLNVVGATGMGDIDEGRGPLAEDNGPLFLPHGRVLGVVVPGEAE